MHRMERIYPWSRRFKLLFFHDSLEVLMIYQFQSFASFYITRLFSSYVISIPWPDYIAVNFACLLVVGWTCFD